MKKLIFFAINIFFSFIFTQKSPELYNFHKLHNQINYLTGTVPEPGMSLSFNFHGMFNSGHANLENQSEITSPGKYSAFFSSRYSFSSKFFFVELEPFLINHKSLNDETKPAETFDYNNHHLSGHQFKEKKMGIRQSRISIHYKYIGLSYGKMSHWWGPGSHSSIVLSSNSPSQISYTFGTLKTLKFKKISYAFDLLIMPYQSQSDKQLYFSGLNAKFIYNSDPIIELGFQRTYLSGDQIQNNTVGIDKWNFNDAVSLVFEPLFSRSKRNYRYTQDGTPGFDIWDQVLSGYFKLTFPEDNLNIFVSLASDDARGNLSDLKAHWDHTLGYQIGLQKNSNFYPFQISFLTEYLSLKTSNTFNPLFYRGDPNAHSFYTKSDYDHFTYKSRRMGAHSGTSSDDLIFMVSIYNEYQGYVFSYGIERRGIKSKIYPEKSVEIDFTFYKNISKSKRFFVNLEYETINNLNFIEYRISDSLIGWFGVSFNI